jgi:hypothetical protein
MHERKQKIFIFKILSLLNHKYGIFTYLDLFDFFHWLSTYTSYKCVARFMPQYFIFYKYKYYLILISMSMFSLLVSRSTVDFCLSFICYQTHLIVLGVFCRYLPEIFYIDNHVICKCGQLILSFFVIYVPTITSYFLLPLLELLP